MEEIDLMNGVDEGANRVCGWGKRCLEAKVKKVEIDAKQLE